MAESVARRFGWTGPMVADEELLAVDVAAVLARKQQAAESCHASQWALSPMTLSAITLALDAGVGMRDVQDFARHTDPKTTRGYDRSRNQLNRHATYAIAQYLAGGN